MMITFDFCGLADAGLITFPSYVTPEKPAEYVIETVQLTGNNTNTTDNIFGIADTQE